MIIVKEAWTINVSLPQALALIIDINMTVSDVPSCGITYSHNSEDSNSVIYVCNIFIVQDTGVGKHSVLHFGWKANNHPTYNYTCKVLLSLYLTWLKHG